MRYACLLATSLILTPVAAQVQVSFKTVADLGVFANKAVDAARSGTAITRGLSLGARDSIASAQSTAVLVVGSTRQPGDGAAIRWGGRATTRGKAGTTAGLTAIQGAQQYVLSLSARASVTGRLLLEFGGRVSDSSASASAAVDIGGRVVIRLPSGTPVRREIPITVGTSGLDIKLTVDGSADASTVRESIYDGSLSVVFVSGTGGPGCTIATDKASCREGGSFAGAFARSSTGVDLNLGLGGALPGATGFLVVSPRGDVVRFGGTGCVLLSTVPSVVGMFRTDGSGNARLKLSIPRVVPGEGYLQAVTAVVSRGGARLATSNTLKAVCR